jgi:hypothetical protein
VSENIANEIEAKFRVRTRRLGEERMREVNWRVMMIIVVIVIVMLSPRVMRREYNGQQGV